MKSKIHGEKGKSSRLKLRQIILDFIERIDVYRYGIPIKETQRTELEKELKKLDIPQSRIDTFIKHYNDNLKSSKNITYKLTFKSGMVRLINVNNFDNTSVAIDDETLQIGHSGRVFAFENSINKKTVFTQGELNKAWKLKW